MAASAATKRRAYGVSVVLGVALLLAACATSSGGQSPSGNAFSPHASVRGQHITVLLPYPVSQKILKQFTQQTGVTLTYQTAGWDNVKAKLIVANEAQTYIADVTEFDWSFTGQFGGGGWYEPLESALGPTVIKDLGNVNRAFDTKGHTYAACYSNDYRFPIYNKKDFAAAGIKQFPTTFAGLASALNTLKRTKAAPYAMSLPLGATEGGVTPWYLLTLAMGGRLFNDKNQPVFGAPGSPAYKALEFEITARRNGWISPGSVTLDDTPALNNFEAGNAALLLAAGPGNLPLANDPSQSKIAPNARAALMPGVSGPGSSFGLPEGLAIPDTAQHKNAALAFIKWWLEPKIQVELYKSAGFLPCRISVLRSLAQQGLLQGSPAALQEISHVVPLFPAGTPIWYSKFDTEAQELINAANRGTMSVRQAIQKLSSDTAALAGGSGS
jgi:multiple sugar transport system substrate-binding protein